MVVLLWSEVSLSIMKKQLVILAGGKGTRLKGHLPAGMPKPMVEIDGKPLLQHQIELAVQHGFRHVVMLVSYGAQAIVDYFADGEKFGVEITYVTEAEPLGTAGAVLAALPDLSESFMVMYGDTLLDVDLARLWHQHNCSAAVAATLFVHPNTHPYDSDLIEIDQHNNIKAIHACPHPPDQYYANRVNAALYVLKRDALLSWVERLKGQSYDLAKDLFPRMLCQGQLLKAYCSREYIKDIGTPDRLARGMADYKRGRLATYRLNHSMPAVFLDRDGVINKDSGYVKSTDEFMLLSGVPDAIKRLNQAGLLTVVVTNQPVVARGECDESMLSKINNKMETLLGGRGAYLDAIYQCVHHPHKGFVGERVDLKIACDCRKPATGMIDRAVAELNIDLNHSWLIGDSRRDIQAGFSAGVKTVLVGNEKDRESMCDICSDYKCNNLSEAVDLMLSHHAGNRVKSPQRLGKTVAS